ncbi:MAG: DUF4159 domain-containing protein [Planctomycetota bacterium]
MGASILTAALVGAARPPDPALAPARRPASDAAQVVAAEPYDGRFVFARVRYNAVGGGQMGSGLGGYGRYDFGGSSWNHDYPDADLNMARVLDEVTAVVPVTGSSVVVDLEDPAVFDYPILYMSEPGFWRITDEGARNLRTHLLKGGFIIFDDFDGYGHWENFERQMRQALPEYRPVVIDETHPIFRTFFFVEDIYVPNPMVRGLPKPTYLGIFENDDPSERMLALINYNSDLAEYWEYAGTGFLAIDPTNDAFRLGVNYLIHGLTH